jgi:hypothetical protein
MVRVTSPTKVLRQSYVQATRLLAGFQWREVIAIVVSNDIPAIIKARVEQ